MNRFLLLLILCLPGFSICSVAQNLVPNPSFELAHRKPEKNGNSIARTKDWIPPIGNSDYYMKGAGKQVGTAKNVFGKQKPHTGNAYAGICTRTKFLEYLEVKLIDTLKKDQEYLVEFYISRAEKSLGSVKEFGVLFTNKKIWGLTGRGIANKPQIIFTNSKGYKNKKKWTKLSSVYKAKGNESFLILGHFNYDPSDNKRKILCHYYIDDVSITIIEKKDDPILSIKIKDSIPKSFSPKLGETVTLQNIFFKTNKSELLPGSFLELDKLVQYLNETPNTSIKIIGHTDNTGNEEQNKTLSELRAKAVADYLKLKGTDRLRINYIGYGSLKPTAINDTDEGKQQNRRVEFIINEKQN
jgi:outer membrane protein OmpA-like peptidoglycan-associated protein